MSASDLLEISCVHCGGANFATIYEDNPSRIVRCRRCDLVFFNPQPTEHFLQKYYSTREGYLSFIEENLRSYRDNPAQWNRSFQVILDKLFRYLPDGEPHRLLDIGAAYGFFLLYARSRGWVVEGVELSSETSRFARENGVRIHTGQVMSAPFGPGTFDAVTMNNVLEHTRNPVAELDHCRKILRPGGVVYIAVPNFDSLVARADNFYWKMKSWPNHLFYFTADTLGALLTRAGFTILEHFTHAGESEPAHDRRVLRERLFLQRDCEIDEMLACLWKIGQGQELVMIAQRMENALHPTWTNSTDDQNA